MNDPVTKASLLRDMRAAWRESEALLAGLGEVSNVVTANIEKSNVATGRSQR